jgi:hypothetical protein
VGYILRYSVLDVGAGVLMLRIIVPGKSIDKDIDRGQADRLAVSGGGQVAWIFRRDAGAAGLWI